MSSIKTIKERIQTLNAEKLKPLLQKFAGARQKAFGEFNFSWQAPTWLKKLTRYRRPLIGALAGVTIIGLAIHFVQNYLDSLPKPNYCHYAINVPFPRDVENDKKASPLTVSFQCSAAPINALSKTLDNPPELSPEIKGSWKWDTDRLLVFTPSAEIAGKDWPVGQKFKLKFDKKILNDAIILEDYQPAFTTEKLRATVMKNEFYIDPTNSKIKKTLVNLTFNYPIDPDEFKKHVEMRLQTKQKNNLKIPGQNYGHTVSFDKFLKHAYISSENIPAPEEESVMSVRITEGYHAQLGGAPAESNDEIQITIPGKSDTFRINKASMSFVRNEKFEPEQIVVIETSIAAKSEDIQKSMKVWMLPRLKDEKQNAKNRFDQWSVGEVSDSVLSKSTPLTLDMIPTEHDTSTIHSFKIHAAPQRMVYLHIAAGVRALDEYVLNKEFKTTIRIQDFPTELMIMSDGALLSLHGEKKLPLLSRNVQEVEFRVSKILPDQLNQAITQVFQRSYDFAKPSFDSWNTQTFVEVFKDKVALTPKNAQATNYFSFDLGSYLNKGHEKKGLFFVEVRDTKTNQHDKRLILLTDLGVIVKQTAGKTHEVFVQSLSNGQAVGGATVEVMGTNGISLFSERTDANGHAGFPNLSDFKDEKAPVAFIVRKDNDISFIPFQYYDRNLNYSRFETGGVYEDALSENLTAMIFSDRGMYRPGEKLSFGFMLRSKNWKTSFKDVPFSWRLIDPRGTVVKTEKFQASSTDLKELSIETLDTWYTGSYSFEIYLVKDKQRPQLIGSTNVQVEEFLPDQMKITTHLSKEKALGWNTPADMKGLVILKNLFGTAAEKRRIEASVDVSPFHPNFKPLKDYHFVSLNKPNERDYHTPLEASESNSAGEASFDLDLNQFNAGMYLLRFEAKGFDAAGGRSVVAASSTIISPLKFLVGYKADGDLRYIKKNSARQIDFIAVDPDVKKIAATEIKFETIEKRYVSVLTQAPDGSYKYQSVTKEITLGTQKVAIPEKGLQFKLNTERPGDFILVVKNSENLELNRFDYSVMAEANLSRKLDRTAELKVSLNKSEFNPGEEIEMQINAPYTGAGLITIERDKIYASKWFKASTTSTMVKIKIPEGLEGNAYINVTLLRSTDSNEIFMSPLSFAVTPFNINLDSHRTLITLDAPALVKPGQKLKINFAANRKTPMILWGVDEGILQIAHYKQPDPIGFFFQKRALQVATWQTLDLLMPEYSLFKSAAGAGGDGSSALGRNLNPFKRKSNPPVVFWSGVLEAGPRSEDYVVEIPDYYNGNIKIFALAATERSYGVASTQTLVRGDIILTPTAPLVVAPNDEFELGVGVANQAEGSGPKAQIKVDLQTSEFFVPIGEKSQTVQIAEGHEGEVHFRLKTNSKLGSGKVVLLASTQGKSAKYAIETSIRPNAPFIADAQFGILEKSTTEFPIERILFPEYRKQSFSASASPLSLFKGMTSYFSVYPYLCTEQLLSAAVPNLFLTGEDRDPKKQNESFKKALEVLRGRQTTDGGYALYPGGSTHLLVTVYAMHFLTEARAQGLSVPDDLYNYSLAFIKTLRPENYRSLADLRLVAQSLYLLARNGVLPTNQLIYLKSFLTQNFKGIWEKDDVAIFMAASFKLLKQDDVGEKLIKTMKFTDSTPSDYAYMYDSTIRNSHLLWIIAKHFPNLASNLFESVQLKTLLAPLQKNQYNTYSLASLYFALGSMSKTASEGPLATATLANLNIQLVDAQNKSERLVLQKQGLVDSGNFSEKIKKIKATTDLNYPIFYSLNQSGFDFVGRKSEVKNGIEISRTYTNEKGEELKSVKLGDTVEVHVRARSLSATSYFRVAIVDLFPGGFEYVVTPHDIVSGETATGDSTFREDGRDMNSEGQNPAEESEDGLLPNERQDPPAPPDEGLYRHQDSPFKSASLSFTSTLSWFRQVVPAAYAATAMGTSKNFGREPAATKLSSMMVEYADAREDRIVIYTSLDASVREFTYKIKAVNIGKFAVPPTFGEDLYDRSARYIGIGSEINVEKK